MKNAHMWLIVVLVVVGAAQIAFTQEDKLPQVSLINGHFTANGKPFIPVGAHWVPAKAAMQWPTQWDPKEIEADFAKMHELGYTITRFDLLWAWFEPRPGDYNPEAFKQLDYLISLAHKYKIYLHPSLFIGGEVGEAFWDVPWRLGRNPHTDPDMLMWETNLAQEFGRRYGKETAIIAWDLTDEPPFWIVPNTGDAAAINWTRLIVDGIRKYDKMHPIVVGTSGEEEVHGPFRADNIAPEVDFFSVHPFTLYLPELFPDSLVSERGTYGAGFEIALSQGAGRPVMIHEMGASTAQFSPETVATYDKLMLYSGLGAGLIGVDLWCYSDASPQQYHKTPYLRTPQETQWGMVTWDRQDKPLAREFKKFAQVVKQLDLEGVSPAPADSAIVIPDEWAKPHGDFSHLGLTGPEIVPYVSTDDGDAVAGQASPRQDNSNEWLMGSAISTFVLAHRAGMKAGFPREYSDWQKYPILLMPSPLTSTGSFIAHPHTDFWEKAKSYVENGGFLYASVAADAAIPQMESIFGARLVDKNTASDITITVVAPFASLKKGDTFHFTIPAANNRYFGSYLGVMGGTVIATDQDGRPALIANTLGKGKTLLSAYPIESYLAQVPSAFDKPEHTHAIYQAFMEWTGLKSLFRTDQPSVEATALSSTKSGYVVLVNHSAKSETVNVTSSTALHSLRVITPQGPQPLQVSGTGWKMSIGAHDAVVVEWN